MFGKLRILEEEVSRNVKTSATALADAVATVRRRWGMHSVVSLDAYRQPLRSVPSSSTDPPLWWPSTTPATQLMEMGGADAGGPLALALLWLAAVPADGPLAVIDLDGCMYPPAAVVCGIDLRRLVIIRPPSRRNFFHVIRELTRCGGFDAILGLLGKATCVSLAEAGQLRSFAHEARTAVLLIHDAKPEQGPRFPLADTRLRVAGRTWLWDDGELSGQCLCVDMERSRLGLADSRYELTLRLYRQGTHGTQSDHLYLDSTLRTRGQRAFTATRS